MQCDAMECGSMLCETICDGMLRYVIMYRSNEPVSRSAHLLEGPLFKRVETGDRIRRRSL